MLPPIPLPQRTWAASEIDFVSPVSVGAAIERRTVVASIDEKRGGSGSMVFVTLDHEFAVDGVVVIRERQQIVYREAPQASASLRLRLLRS